MELGKEFFHGIDKKHCNKEALKRVFDFLKSEVNKDWEGWEPDHENPYFFFNGFQLGNNNIEHIEATIANYIPKRYHNIHWIDPQIIDWWSTQIILGIITREDICRYLSKPKDFVKICGT